MCIGIPGQIVELDPSNPENAWAEVSGVRREVNIALVRKEGEDDKNLIGSWVLIHVGFALSRMEEDEAKDVLAGLQEMGEVEEDAALFLAGRI
ncbi:hydrogenase assembly chaperone [Lasius niger]|uniref:Hydrogenase assembly chaperone n=1 Tax=Lasius niger TaxID=67767 RepID=A0A0J7NCG9_LASNI|nr:hydrogenase assembly chaperone [Lasius niger]KMQ90270.1 hydrogenase assembly chaperone [Lasius niger]